MCLRDPCGSKRSYPDYPCGYPGPGGKAELRWAGNGAGQGDQQKSMLRAAHELWTKKEQLSIGGQVRGGHPQRAPASRVNPSEPGLLPTCWSTGEARWRVVQGTVFRANRPTIKGFQGENRSSLQLSKLGVRPREGGGPRESLTSKLSQMPLATFPSVLASRGDTSMRSAHLRRSMWRTGSDRHFHIWQREGSGVTGPAILSVWREVG